MPTSETTTIAEVTEKDHVRGDATAPITLVEYGEFECPACGRAYHVVKQLLADHPHDVRFVFRHFARDDVHPFSERSAEAAEAAGAQGRFWEMHDFLFEHQHQLEHDDLDRHAAGLGLDPGRFRADMSAHAHRDRVRADLADAVGAGLAETPSFFLDGERYEGAVTVAALGAAVRARLS